MPKPSKTDQDRAPSPKQLAYLLRTGKRFRVGKDAKRTRTAVVIDVHNGWLEIHFEDARGKPTTVEGIGLELHVFRASILAELDPLSTEECERRAYR
jgi:hypothetical protein